MFLKKPHLPSELKEEEFGQASDALIVVNDTGGQLADLTCHLQHVVQNQVGEHPPVYSCAPSATRPEVYSRIYETYFFLE